MNTQDYFESFCILAISVSLFFSVKDYAEQQENILLPNPVVVELVVGAGK